MPRGGKGAEVVAEALQNEQGSVRIDTLLGTTLSLLLFAACNPGVQQVKIGAAEQTATNKGAEPTATNKGAGQDEIKQVASSCPLDIRIVEERSYDDERHYAHEDLRRRNPDGTLWELIEKYWPGANELDIIPLDYSDLRVCAILAQLPGAVFEDARVITTEEGLFPKREIRVFATYSDGTRTEYALPIGAFSPHVVNLNTHAELKRVE